MNSPQEDIANRSRSGFLWIASTSAVWQILSWVITFYTARILSVKDFGIAALPGTIIPYLGLVASLQLQTWIVQTKVWNKEKAATISSLSLLLGISASLIAFFCAPYIATFYQDESLILMFQICAWIFLIDNLSLVASAELHRAMRFKQLSLITMGVNITQSILTLLLAIYGFGYWALIVGILYNHVAKTVCILSLQGLSFSFSFQSETCKDALRFGFAAASASALWIVFSTTDDVVVGKLFGTTQLGFYTMAYFFSQLPLSKLNMIISPVLTPYYSNLRNSGVPLATPFLYTCRIVVAIAAPALIGLSVVAKEAIVVMIGSQWVSIVPIVQILCLVSVMQSISMNSGSLFNALGKPQIVAQYNAASAILLPILFILGATLFDLPGVYFAWLLGYPCILGYILIQLRRTLNITIIEMAVNLRAPMTSAVMMAIAVMICRNLFFIESSNIVVVLTSLISVGAITYSAAMLLLFKKDTLEIIQTKNELTAAK